MPAKHDYLEKCKKLVVMGGTFDPIHNGHIAVAEAILAEYSPQRVLFVPGGQPPHKPPVTPGEHRFRMTLAAVCQNPAFDVSRIEIDREGPSYTVDTLEDLRRICPPKARIYFVIGADMLAEILTWHGAKRIFPLCELIAVCRPGYEIDEAFVENLREKYGAKIHIFEGPGLQISGTMLREKISQNKPVSGLMPKDVADYAKVNGLYDRAGPALTPEYFEAVQDELKKWLSNKRFKHTLGTVIAAEELALRFGENVEKARWAALLHDCAKEFSAAKKHALCEAWGITLDKIMLAHIDITHSLLGAEVARRHFHITDAEILQAISRHTMGGKNLTKLDKIIMLADYIEPHRDSYPVIDKQREQSLTSIDAALITGIRATNADLIKRARPIHPWSAITLEELKGATK